MRKNATKLAAAVLSLAMVMTSVSMPASAATTKKAKLNKTKATLYTNGTKTTTLKVLVGKKSVKATFKSSNTKILTVGKTTGKVTAKKNGTATVTATYKKKAYKCKITVKTYATSITSSTKTINLEVGKTATIKKSSVKVLPSTASNKTFNFTSSNKSVATVGLTGGKVTAKKKGTAKIYVTALGSKGKAKKATITVNVTEPDVTPTETPSVTPGVTETPVPTETPSVATEGTISVTTNISGASITIMDGSKVVASGSAVDGKPLTTGKIPNGTYVVTVSKEGYKPYTQSVIVNGTDETVDVKLEEVKPEEVKAALKDAIKIRETKVQVNFTNKIAVPTKDNFAIDGLTIKDVALSEDQKSVILTVSDKLELDKTYAVSTKNIVDANGEAVTDGTVDFTARKVEYTAVMQITDPKTGEVKNELKSDGADTAKVEVTLYDNANHIVKDDAEMTFTATAGNFAEKKVTVQNGVASILFTSEISSKKIESLLTATVTESSNAELKNTKAERRISLNPNIEGQKDQTVGASLTDVMVETCDRVVLFFNKDVDVTNYTKNTDEEKYAYDSNRMEIKILDNAKTLESIPDGAGTISPKALIPVKDNPKALCAILDTDSRDNAKYLTDNAKAIVKVTDKTKTIPVTETKSTLVSDIRTPSILDVKQNGLRSIDVIFSEPVQNGIYNTRTNSAEVVEDKDKDKWVIDTRTLSDDSWGVAPKRAKAEVGKFDVKTGEDRRNVVTITLGKKANGDQIYFKAGKHSVQGNKIGDWANVTDTNNNFINTQTLDFTIEADETAPKMDVKVESPEQYYVTFNTDVDANKVKANLKLQQYKDNTWKNIDDINIRPVGTSQKEFIVELTKDWTDKDILDTYTSKKNYYNYNFRLHMDEKVLTNLSNGLKNAEINYNLDDAIMKNPDVTSPKLKDVTQNGQKNVKIEFSEPAQIKMGNDHQITPKAEQGDLSLPIIQFISEDNSKTIKGKVEKVDDHDTSIYVVPDGESLTAGTWKVVVRNVSDDIGNTAETLVKNDFVVKGDIPADTGFRVRWIVAVPENTIDPITGNLAASDVIYVKFNKQIKTYGNAANAGATTNYTVNDYPLPTSKIDAFVDKYNKPASTYGYSDIVAIHLKDTALTASSNTININKTLESAAGAKLDNGGKFLLSKENGRTFFTWNYKNYSDSKSMTVSDVQKLLNDETYNSIDLSNVTTDLQKATLELKHSGTVDFAGKKVHELTINTMETGILEVKNINADKVTVYAPYAEVIINNASINHNPTDPANIGELVVEDVLNGTLTLSNSIVDKLTVTDSNEGKVSLEGANTAIKTAFVIDTTGEITLEVGSPADKFDVKNLPASGVTVNKACTLHLQNDGATLGSGITVKAETAELAKKVTVTANEKGLVNTGASDVTVKAEDAKEVVISDVTSKNGEDAAVKTPAEPAETVYTIGGDKVATGGWITVNVANTKPVSIEVSKDDTPAKLAAAIAKETFKGYTVKVDSETKSKLIFTSVKTGKEAEQFDVTIDFGKSEGLTAGASTKTPGKAAVTEKTPGSSSFTISGTGKNVAGKIVVTIDDKTLEVEVGAFDEIATIAGAFSTELAKKTELAKLYFVETAQVGDSNAYTITFKTGTSEKPTTGKEAVAPKVTVKFVAK